MWRPNWLIVLLIFITVAIHAQSIRISGKIVDKNTREEIPFAHIFIEHTSIGTISDLYGNFTLSFPEQYRSSTLKVSCLGYKPVLIALKNSRSALQKIQLEQDVTELHEVVVTAENALNLLKEAFRKIPENYDTSHTIVSGYYKLESRFGDKNVNYTETFIDIFKPPYTAYFDDKKNVSDSIRVVQARTKPNEIKDWKLNATLQWDNSLYQLENLDVAKEFVYKDSFRKFIRTYRFEIEKMVVINGRDAYMIRIKPKKYRRDSWWNGYIFIDRESKAFVKFDLISTPNLFRKLKMDLGYAILSNLYKVHYEKGEWKESIVYQLMNDKWYFKEVNSSKHFLISSKKRNLEKAPLNITRHYYTDSITRNVAMHDSIEFLPNIRAKGWMADNHIRDRYRPDFWKEFDRDHGVVMNDSLYTNEKITAPNTPAFPMVRHDTTSTTTVSNRQNGFTRADTLRGKLSPLRTCYDVTFYHLDVDVDMENRALKGSNVIRFKAAQTFNKMQVDLYANMKIEKILYENIELRYTREFDAVFINFPQQIPKDNIKEITIYYSGIPKEPDFSIPMNGGFLWDTDEKGNPWVQVVCQGSGASLWWPNKDHLSDEPDSMRIWITVPQEFTEISNGRLKKKTPVEGNRMRYEWYVSYPINNYNVTLAIGKYSHFTDQFINKDTLTIDYYVMPYNLEAARELFEEVKPMLQCFEDHFGKYPFSRDGFTLVESPYPMEHQSSVCIGKINTENPIEKLALLWHESAHEWWGNNVSCEDMADLWIHEGFATYAEGMVAECTAGLESGSDYIMNHQYQVINKEPIIGVYDVNHIFYDIGDMYSKGSLMLHTFRNVLNNDPLWFSFLREIQTHFRYGTLTTDDLVNFINTKAKTDYTYFFDQYLLHTSIPELELKLSQQGSSLKVEYRWKADVKDFRMPVKIRTGEEKFDFIYPVSDWKSVLLPEMNADDFEVDEDNFYIKISFVKNEIINLNGIILDDDTSKPLPFATIQVKSQSAASIADHQGEFTLRISQYSVQDTLEVFVVGFAPFRKPLTQLGKEKRIFIRLQPESNLLREVTVTDSLNGNEIMKRVEKNVKKNYALSPFIREGFYREIQKANGQYVSLTEAVIKVYNEGYKNPEKEKIKILQLRKTPEYVHAYNPEFWNTANLIWELLNEDHVRYHLRNSRKQTFEREPDAKINGAPVFVVVTRGEFWPLRFYVQKDNYAVVRIQHFFEEEKVWGLKEQKARVSVKDLFIQYDFKRNGEIYYPDGVSYRYRALFSDQLGKKAPLEYEMRQDLIITGLQIQNMSEFAPNEVVDNGASLWKLQYPLDKKFWENYPVIKERPLDGHIKNSLELNSPLDAQFKTGSKTSTD